MKIQNLAIIFLVIILPLLMILGYYLKLQEDTLEKQSEYNAKLSSSVKEGIKAYEINTVNWREKKGEERRNVNASVNTFLTSLANNLNISGTSKEYMTNYIPAVAVTMYSGYYIYAPAYVSEVLENEQGVQLYYNGTELTTEYSTDGALNDVAYKPANGAASFTTDASQAKKVYKHSLSNQIAYSGTYRKGTVNVTINYTLDNRIYIYGKDAAKDIQEQGCLIAFEGDEWRKLPRIRFKSSDPRKEDDIVLEARVDGATYKGSNINAEILTEQVLYIEESNNQPFLRTCKYIYDITGEKLYYDETKDEFFTISDATKKRNYLNNSPTLKADDEGCRFKSVSVLTGDGSTYKKLFQALNGRDKGKWYISLKTDSKKITEVGPGVEVIDTEIKDVLKYGFSAIYMDYSAISYYVEGYAFTKWIGQRLGGEIVQTKIAYDETNKQYKNVTETLKNIFVITKDNDIEVEGSPIWEHKRNIMIDSINSNLNLSISNYSRNSKNEYKLPVLTSSDWDQVFKNLSMIAFFQGVPIGLKTYNNYAIATSTQNRDYVDPDELFFSSKSQKYHRPYCVNLTKNDVKDDYIGYRSVEYSLRTYEQKNKETTYYYQHVDQNSTSTKSDEACYDCIINKAEYERLDEKQDASLTPDQKTVKHMQIKAYKEALARERYYQNVELAADLGIMIRYHENIPAKASSIGIVTGVTNMPEDQEALPNVRTTISTKIPVATTNDRYIKLICTGWSLDPNAEVVTYEKGNSYIFEDSVDLYAIWSISLGGLQWREDFTPSISKINRGEDTANGSNINMVGNGYNPGKGAIWTTVASDHLKITEYSFSFAVYCGHSFNAAGLMFNVVESGNTLEGYLFSVNFRGQFTSGGSGSIYKFVYNKNKNSSTFENLTLVQSLNVPIQGSGRQAMFSGRVAIKVTDTGYIFTSDFSPDIPIDVVGRGDRMYPKSFGFFSEHMSHACGDIGSFKLEDIQVKIDFI